MKTLLNNVGNLVDATTAQSVINSNNATIQVAFDNTLSRDGTQPNQMNSNLDMNSNRIVNLPVGVNPDEPVTVGTFNAVSSGKGNVPIGGSVNQVLAKNSSADFDTRWTNSITSVGLSLPTDFAVSGSPVTTAGTLTANWATLPTGTGAVVRATNPTFTTNIATGTINNVAIVGPASTASLTLGSGKSVAVNNSLTLAGTDGTTLTFQGTDTYVGRTTTDALVNKTINAGSNTITGTASGLTAGSVTTNANLTGAVTSVGNATSLGSFTSANLKTALTDETGSGAAVFATSPALVTPTGIVKGDVGLGNVDNTSDVTKYAAVKTLTNTTYDTAGTGNAFSINGVAATANTGTGSVVRATSPTLVTPVLGAATATTINGAALDNNAWSTYTPTITAQTGTPTTVTANGHYKQIGKVVVVSVQITVTTVGTATGYMVATLPVTGAVSFSAGSSYESATTGNGGAAYYSNSISTTTFRITNISAATYWVNGYIVTATITYEAA